MISSLLIIFKTRLTISDFSAVTTLWFSARVNTKRSLINFFNLDSSCNEASNDSSKITGSFFPHRFNKERWPSRIETGVLSS